MDRLGLHSWVLPGESEALGHGPAEAAKNSNLLLFSFPCFLLAWEMQKDEARRDLHCTGSTVPRLG